MNYAWVSAVSAFTKAAAKTQSMGYPAKFVFSCLAMLPALGLVGCSAPLVESAVTSNRVQEQAHNAYLLLNILRAKDRMPMHFTQVNAVRAAPGGWGVGTPTLEVGVPFNSAAKSVNALTLGVAAESSVDTVSLVSQAFMRGLTKPVDPELMGYFISQRWPTSMLLHMFVGSIEIYDEKKNLKYVYFNIPGHESFPLFNFTMNVIAGCGMTPAVEPAHQFYGNKYRPSGAIEIEALAAAAEAGLIPVGVGEDNGLIDDDGRSVVDATVVVPPNQRYLRLAKVTKETVFRLRDDLSGMVPPAPGTPKKCISLDTASVRKEYERATGKPDLNDDRKSILPSAVRDKLDETLGAFESVGIKDSNADIQRKIFAGRRPGPSSKPDVSKLEAKLVLRSVQSMIYYLGELSRDGAEPVKVAIGKPGDGNVAKLFELKQCDLPAEAAVSVKHRAAHYCIKPTGLGEEDRSIQTLALLTLMFTLQNHSAEAPTISNVRVLNR